MAESVIDFQLTGSAQDILDDYKKLIRQQEKAIDVLRRQVKESKKAGQAQTQANKEVISGIGSMIIKYGAATVAVDLLRKAITRVIDENRKLKREIQSTTVSFDQSIRGLVNQLGLDPKDIPRVTRIVGAKAQRFALPQQEVINAIRESASAGATTKEALGGFSDQVIRGAISQNFRTGIGIVSTSFANFLTNFGEQLTEESGKRLAQITRALFGKTVFQIPDLPKLGRGAATAQKAGIDIETFLASGALAKGVTGTAELAGTGILRIIDRLRTVKPSGDLKQFLKRAGLRIDDFDLIGETFTEALERIKTGIDKLPKADQPRFVKEFFGEFNAIIEALVDQLPKLKSLIAQARDPGGLKAAVQLVTAGPFAESVRLQARRAGRRFQPGRPTEIAEEQILEDVLDRLERTGQITVMEKLVDQFSFFVRKIITLGDEKKAVEGTLADIIVRQGITTGRFRTLPSGGMMEQIQREARALQERTRLELRGGEEAQLILIKGSNDEIKLEIRKLNNAMQRLFMSDQAIKEKDLELREQQNKNIDKFFDSKEVVGPQQGVEK